MDLILIVGSGAVGKMTVGQELMKITDFRLFHNHMMIEPVIEIFGRLYQGDKSDDPKIADIMPYARRNGIFKDKYFKLYADRPCRTITAHLKMDCLSHIHPYQIRSITPREAARVQSFPDDYVFLGAYLKTYMQVGNAVPPMMAKSIAEVIMNYLKMTYDKDRPIDKENK